MKRKHAGEVTLNQIKVTLDELGEMLGFVVERMVTKDEAKGFATKNDLNGFATKEDLKRFATKDDLKNFATKDDLKNFATKDDLKNFATKDDLKNFATKDDLKNFATKDDLNQSLFTLQTQMNGIEADIRDMKHSRLEVRVADLEEKVFGKAR